MKKILTVVILCSFLQLFSQKQRNFSFVKSTITFLEKQVKFNFKDESPEFKKRMLGVFLIKDSTDIIDYSTAKYIKFSEILPNEVFSIYFDGQFGSHTERTNLFITNVKSKQRYAIMTNPVDMYDYTNHDIDSERSLMKWLPIQLTSEENAIFNRYKTLIASAKINRKTLSSIQKKYLTRGYFDSNRVSSVDRKIYNTNYNQLKSISEKLSEIVRYEDKDEKIKNRLPTAMYDDLISIGEWSMSATKI